MAANHRLSTILAADVAGYSWLMGSDEEGTLERLKAVRHELLRPQDRRATRPDRQDHRGMLVEFASVVDAVRCPVAVQQAMPERNAGVAADRIDVAAGIEAPAPADECSIR